MKFAYPILTLILLPLIALIWPIHKVVTFFKRSSKNGMIYLEDGVKKVLYSPYFEFETYLEDTRLLIKLVFTLSNEGIAKTTHAPLTNAAQKVGRRLHIFREATLFFINQGETPVEVTPKYLEVDAESIYKLDDQPQLIASGHYHECEPAMAMDVQDRRNFDFKIVLEYKGEMHELIGSAKRMTVEQVQEKYKDNKEHYAAQ